MKAHFASGPGVIAYLQTLKRWRSPTKASQFGDGDMHDKTARNMLQAHIP
jgi:hypothetical protein